MRCRMTTVVFLTFVWDLVGETGSVSWFSVPWYTVKYRTIVKDLVGKSRVDFKNLCVATVADHVVSRSIDFRENFINQKSIKSVL